MYAAQTYKNSYKLRKMQAAHLQNFFILDKTPPDVVLTRAEIWFLAPNVCVFSNFFSNIHVLIMGVVLVEKVRIKA